MPRHKLLPGGGEVSIRVADSVPGSWAVIFRMRVRGFPTSRRSSVARRLWMHRYNLQSPFLRHGQKSIARTRELGDAGDETARELRQSKAAVNFVRQLDERFRAPAMLFRKMQIPRYLQHHGSLV